MFGKLFDVLGKMPSTNTRIAVTLLCVVATAVRVVALGWNPSLEWLGFLVAMSGIDAAQYFGKRSTFQSEAPK